MKVENPYKNNTEANYKMVVAITQCLRFKVLNRLLKNGLPNDKEDKEYLLKILKDTDSTALATKKVEGDAALVDSKIELFEVVKTTLNAINKNPFINESNNTESNVELPTFERIDGESFIGLDEIPIDVLDPEN